MADGLFSRLRSWLRSLLGRGSSSPDPEAEAATSAGAVEAAYKCDVCGTPVDAPDDPCPLCHSTAIVPVDAGGNDVPNPSEAAPDGPEAVERRVAESRSGDAAASLADLRKTGKDVLARHADKWEDRESAGSRRYRVTLPKGEERLVGSREDVRALLFRHYGVEHAEDEEATDDGAGRGGP